MAEVEEMEVERSEVGNDVPSSSTQAGNKKRFEVKKWSSVALWSWDIVVGKFTDKNLIFVKKSVPLNYFYLFRPYFIIDC